jgi:apolipoprotein N-acyltransferase
VSWVYVSLSVFGGMPWWLAGPAAFLFCAVMALFPMAAGWIFKHRQPLHFWQQAILFASLLALGDWIRSWLFTGFPGWPSATRKPRPARWPASRRCSASLACPGW